MERLPLTIETAEEFQRIISEYNLEKLGDKYLFKNDTETKNVIGMYMDSSTNKWNVFRNNMFGMHTVILEGISEADSVKFMYDRFLGDIYRSSNDIELLDERFCGMFSRYEKGYFAMRYMTSDVLKWNVLTMILSMMLVMYKGGVLTEISSKINTGGLVIGILTAFMINECSRATPEKKESLLKGYHSGIIFIGTLIMLLGIIM